ncbi:MAG: hypothetical protein LBT59_11645 [Clostridiales bacterium]|nr:hypothetical protein [Clostridiales bacterium]
MALFPNWMDDNQKIAYLSKVISDTNHENDLIAARAEGRAEGEKRVTISMISNGADDEFIMACTQFTRDDITCFRSEEARNKARELAELSLK